MTLAEFFLWVERRKAAVRIEPEMITTQEGPRFIGVLVAVRVKVNGVVYGSQVILIRDAPVDAQLEMLIQRFEQEVFG